jgi:hypothetical protein
MEFAGKLTVPAVWRGGLWRSGQERERYESAMFEYKCVCGVYGHVRTAGEQ